jgi:hypothetical protein
LLLTEALGLFLECLDLMPGLEPLTHDSKIEFLHKKEILIHIKKHITGDLLFFEDVTVFWINTEPAQAPCGL